MSSVTTPGQRSTTVRPRRVLVIAGAILAFLIGSGFATG